AERARERGDPELAAGRALPAGELLARTGDWTRLEALARDEMERCATLHMIYEEAWARLLLARALLATGREEDAALEARQALESAQRSDLRGIVWRASAWLAESFGDRDPELLTVAADGLERFVEGFSAEERSAYLTGSGADALLGAWWERARKAKATAVVERLAAMRQQLHPVRS
ncbi:MAG TPA: hypothetical protein VJY35_10020, partial [Candidatus Eisenbacteria bacterium]|nr:hypothetical protein [Candidatus Eisenbacteria bacterium]